jgi:hypothetical protein
MSAGEDDTIVTIARRSIYSIISNLEVCSIYIADYALIAIVGRQ